MTESSSRTPTAARGSLATAAAFGICLVAYSYLAALWLNRQGSTPEPLLFVREWVNKPLGIGEDFGMLGISILLVSGGYVAASALAALSVGRVVATTISRIAVPVVLAITASALISLSGGHPLTEPAEVEVTANGYLTDLLLLGPLTESGSLLGLGWVLTVGAFALVLMLATAPMSGRAPWAAPALQLLVLAILTGTGTTAQGWYHDLGMLAPFMALPVLGQVLWQVRNGGFSGWLSLPLAAGCLGLLIAAEGWYADLAGWFYPLTAVYATAVVLLALGGGGRLASTAPVEWLAGRAFSLFLMLGVIGYATLNALHLLVPLSVAFLAAILLTTAVAEGVHRLAARCDNLLVRASSPGVNWWR